MFQIHLYILLKPANQSKFIPLLSRNKLLQTLQYLIPLYDSQVLLNTAPVTYISGDLGAQDKNMLLYDYFKEI